MHTLVADSSLFDGPGQGAVQIVQIVIAFLLTALIGTEREIHGKSAGLRTQTIVGTAAALVLLVSKYGFFDVLNAGTVVVDPSRVAAQIVSGIGFLGAGLIITRQGSVHGLTTAASVWESAAIGMASAAGLVKLAILVTALHFLIVLGFTPFAKHLAARIGGSMRLQVSYQEASEVLPAILHACDKREWALSDLRTCPDGGVFVTLSGGGIRHAPTALAGIAGVEAVRQVENPDE